MGRSGCLSRSEDPQYVRESNSGPEQRESIVINLSSIPLTEPQNKLLQKGLNFVFTPRVDKFKLLCEVSEFVRKIKLKSFFQDQNISPEELGDTNLRKKSTFIPPHTSIPFEIHTFEKAIFNEIDTLNTEDYKPFNNMTKDEHQALDQLQKNQLITIKPADKGGGIVILDTDMYRTECLRLLEDTNTYKILESDPTQSILNEIRSITEEAELHQWISKKEADFLCNTNPKIPYFYVLPKIHKNKLPPPGRPIVSGIGSVLEPLSQFADHFLKPLVQSTPTYLKDTGDLLRILKDLTFDPQVNLLVSLDVESLYTSIPQQAGLEVLEEILYATNWEYNTPRHFILDCARLALTRNFFQFEDTLYLQKHGTSMGSSFAPSMAGLYVHSLEHTKILVETNPFFENIIIWKRYIDDVFVIWRGEVREGLSFMEWLNILDQNLKFTHTVTHNHLVFLDLEIDIHNGGFKTTTHLKPTAKNTLLHFNSFHSRPLRENLPYGQFLRIRRNCSEIKDYRVQSLALSDKLLTRGYPQRIIDGAYKRARNNNRESLLEKSTKTTNSNRLVCVTTYSPISNQLKKIINKNWRILNTGKLNLEKPIFANKRGLNLKDRLVHTRPRSPTTLPTTTLWGLPRVVGHHPCGRCSVCHLTTTTKELDLGLQNSWHLRKFTNCDSTRVVYMITCPCGLKYIGMTSRKIKVRICEHRSNLRCKKNMTKMLNHFLTFEHSVNELRWVVLEQLDASGHDGLLYEKEQRWVYKLQTHKTGLNDDIQFLHFLKN